jgi:hypothetical protein
VFKHSLALRAGGASISISTPECRNYKDSPTATFLLPSKLLSNILSPQEQISIFSGERFAGDSLQQLFIIFYGGGVPPQ